MRTLSKQRHLCALIGALLFSLDIAAQSDFSDAFSGYYAGVEIGTISYNTQITFDGVDDPAGRGGLGYGAFLGYNHRFKKLLVGGEVYYNGVLEPDPYTFDPGVIGFSELDLKRGANWGVDVRGGYLLLSRLLIYGSVGYSHSKQSVLIDGTPLNEFSGGSGAERFGRVRLGLGLEYAFTSSIAVRCAFEQMEGHDLDRSDFGVIASDAALQRLDVEPSLQQFFVGMVVGF